MKYDFCTVADKNFVFKCLSLFNSIEKFMPGSILWILCLDEESITLFKKLNRNNIRIVSVADFNDKELESTKFKRTFREFAWTCKPALMDYLLREKKLSTLIFVDSDLLFYSSLDSVINKHPNSLVMLTSHKFSDKKKYLSDRIGYFNSGFIVFKNSEVARACTARYKAQCIEWCHAYHDKGRHGDQSYLNDWPQKFSNVKEIPEKGVNLGTWNLERYKIIEKNAGFLIDENQLVCYHFHGFIVYKSKSGRIKPYPITVHHKKIYRSYVQALQEAYNQIIQVDQKWNYGFALSPGILRVIKQTITRYIKKIWQ